MIPLRGDGQGACWDWDYNLPALKVASALEPIRQYSFRAYETPPSHARVGRRELRSVRDVTQKNTLNIVEFSFIIVNISL